MSDITIVDVGPRDGLQNEPVVLAPAVRARLVDRLVAAGLRGVEAASFVHPKLVPAMAGAEEVFSAIERRPGTAYTGLILNERGYDRACSAGVDDIRYGFAVTDAFGMQNQNQTTAQGLSLARRLVSLARRDGKRIGITLSVAFGCPFSGRVDPAHVLRLVDSLMETPPDDVALADTIGVAVPTRVTALVRGTRSLGARTAAHLHNTRNTGLANAVAALDAGATIFDSSVGGIGGCPFAPRATGNIGTEDLVYLFEEMGVGTGIDLGALIETSRWLGRQLGRELPALVSRAGPFPEAALS